MWTDKPKPYPGELWGFDNGAFAAWKKGLPFPEEEYRKRLQIALGVGIPYLAVVPDIVGGGTDSLYFSMNWLKTLPRNWPWYLAVQDGMNTKDVQPFIKWFKGIFLGGTDDFKRQAPIWKQMAHDHGKRFHYARVSGERKLHHAFWVGADSLDTTQPLWSWDKFNKWVRILTDYQCHPSLLGEEHYAI